MGIRILAALTNAAAAARRLPSRSRHTKDPRTRARALQDSRQPVSDCQDLAHNAESSPVQGDDTDHSTETGPSSKDGGSSGSGSSARDLRSLEDRASEEVAYIKQFDTSQADLWYIVDAQWLQEWKSFVSVNKGGPPPKAISNHRLVDKNGVPKPGLKVVDDYRGVNEKVWEFWHKRYGGGPVIRRRVIDIYSQPMDERRGSGSAGGSALYDSNLPSASSTRSWRREANRGAEAPPGGRKAPSSPGGRSAATCEDESSQSDDSPTRGHSNFSGRAAALPMSTARLERPAPKRSVQSSGLSGAGSQGLQSGWDVCPGVSSPAEAESPPAKLCCDRCDGPHESDKCPHFRKPRDKHQDAWVNHGKGKKDDGGNDGAITIRNATIVPQPPDGSCLFHSLSYGLRDKSTAFSLRKQISDFIARNPNMTIADTAISDWVHYDSGGTVQAYAERMATDPHQWGGGIEMAALTKMKHVNVHVYEKCNTGFRRISAFQSPGAEKTVNVLYQGRMHYDALEVH
mmetsp:Transcript_18997/g.44303  ORF Transcript_18997/g.44303 Transcript_18997/m.44303 type:complete len:514 (-) Transcript_18997:112-1653(-)|eukprot:CAMPEP_0178417376 /NCGR_PEP_ID=MMETSP0689_2-20121128/24541_1 /TAXON_ID=160604 /ORGANISM="Amphidinium massartii, Strain CS-259" /LENGTH=513 /DNA_ID=CAMNT_0020038737 /DNA_START=18 /DNA_END=1559 /DNA_ORIENTATION=+